MNKTGIVILILAICIDSSASAGIMVVRGSQLGTMETNRPYLRSEFAVEEVGRGNLTAKTVEVLFRENSGNQPLPTDAIILLHGPSFSKHPDYGSYLLISPDAAQGIVPYTVDAWMGILQKTDDELSDAPEADRLLVEKAVVLLRGRLYEKYGTPRHIYFYPPRRVPYSWSLAALCVRNGAVTKLMVRISDAGNIVSETPNHHPIKFFDSADVSAEEMELFVRDYHRNTPPDEWPTWDPEPPPAIPESAAGEYDDVPEPRHDSGSAP